jgi:hypothetical protein
MAHWNLARYRRSICRHRQKRFVLFSATPKISTSRCVVDVSDAYISCVLIDTTLSTFVAPTLFAMDAMVRFARDERPELTTDTVYCISSNAHSSNAWRGSGMDGGYKAGHQL